jgi:hypothetical protein
VEAVRPSVRLEGRRRLHPTEFLCGCSISAEVDLRQTQSCVRVFLRTGGSYPGTAPLSGQTAALRQPCRDWNSRLAELVPTPQKHGCANLYFALERLPLRKTPADRLVTLEKAGLRFALNASPSGRRRASLRPGGGRQQVVHFSDYRRTEIINPASSEINLLPEKNGLDNRSTA